MNLRTIIIGLCILLVLGVGVFIVTRRPVSAPTTDLPLRNVALETPTVVGTTTVFTELRTPAFVQSIPANNDELAKAPSTVSVAVSQPLGPSSTIAVMNAAGQPVQLGRPTIGDDRLSMTVLLARGVSGSLRVVYDTCTPENTCRSGQFGFVVRPPSSNPTNTHP